MWGAGCIYGGITRKWCHGTEYKYDGYHQLCEARSATFTPMTGRGSGLFICTLGWVVSVSPQIQSQPCLTMREFCGNRWKSCGTLTHESHCHHRGGRGRVSIMSWLMTMMSWWLCQGLSGNYADLNLCTLVAFYLEWSAERKWNENWNEHPAVQSIGCAAAAQVQANINCSQSAYLQIWNRYLHWKVGMF